MMNKYIFLIGFYFIPAFSINALNPSREYKYTPDKFGMNFKEEKIKTPDNFILNAWFFENSKITTNWMVISGSGDGNMADHLELVNSFLSTGYNVLTYDYRGYGSSSEFKIDPDLYIYPQFITDLNAVLDYLRKTRSIAKFELFGLNIGAGISIGVGANRVETKRIIADGPWHNLEDIKKKIQEKSGREIMLPFGYDKNNEPMYAMTKPKSKLIGLMVIVSDLDPIISLNEIRTIKGITETYVVRNSMSNDQNFSTDKNEYFKRINAFLQK